MKAKLKFFDWEVYPEWWCVVVSDEEDHYTSSPLNYKFTEEEELRIKDKMRVYSSDGGVDEYKALLQDLSTGVISGYNSKRYDMVMTKCISMHFTPRQMYIASAITVDKVHEIPVEMQVTGAEINRISTYVSGWSAKWQGAEAHQDLMDDSDKGLKDKEASLGMDIRETTVPFGKMNLTDSDKVDIIYYCKHDVFALHVFYIVVSKPYIETKLDLGETYDIPSKVCYESTNAVLVSKALGAVRVSGTTIKDPTFVIYEKPLKEYLDKWVPEEALRHLYTSQKQKQMTMFENKVYMADGGIHSTYITPKLGRVQTNLYVEADSEYGIFNIDLAGCHPSVMVFAGAMSRGVTKPERFRASVLGRREVKKKPKKSWTAQEQKLVRGWKLQHNTAYGAMGNKYLPLYDDYMRSKVCRVSQMIVIAVCMNIWTEIPGIKIIQTNTDGILTYMKRSHLTKLKAIIAEFEAVSNFEFELEEDSKIWQLNVNNYIAVDNTGDSKIKGKSFVTSVYQPGTNKLRPLGNHIIAKAQFEWYVNKVNPVKYLLEQSHVNDFALTCTKGGTYYAMVHDTASGPVQLGKVARVVAVKNSNLGEVRKEKEVDVPIYPPNHDARSYQPIRIDKRIQRDLCANCPPNALIVNDALRNYVIEGDLSKRTITNTVTGETEELDMGYYARLLDKVLDIPWYKLHKGAMVFTKEFNLGG